jgi:uncharacterized membrane protein YcfT
MSGFRAVSLSRTVLNWDSSKRVRPALAAKGVSQPPADRVAWVDYAKGWSIILVVTMHSALGVGLAVGDHGWLHEVVAFAKPFRMPDFFLVAGLFAGRVIEGPWRKFLDRKVLHFAYFYALWLLIALAVKSGELGLSTPAAFAAAYVWGFVEPFSSMWFIQLLPILYMTTRLIRRLPTALVLALGATAHIAAASFPDGGKYAMGSNLTGWTSVDSFLLFFIYFYVGHRFGGAVFAFAQTIAKRPALLAAGLATWAIAEELAVSSGLPQIPGATLAFGLAGALAVIACAVLLDALGAMRWLAYCGRNSLTIYLSFFLPMAATRVALIKLGWIGDVGALSLAVTAAAVIGPLAVERATRGTPFAFLYARPAWARLESVKRPNLERLAVAEART